jgi:inositol oxygenase
MSAASRRETSVSENPNPRPLASLEDWDDFVVERYPEAEAPPPAKPEDEFRDYDNAASASVREFYDLNHRYQTWDFVQTKKREFLGLERARMGIWQALELLDTLVDDSDPDLDLSQLDHLLQTAEAIRADGHPDWFVLTGLVHDLGKILCVWGEPQWAVVGDTFPVGCAFDERVVYPELFADNADRLDARFNTRLGVYSEGCGLDDVHLSWGHDEYLYQVFRDHLPEPALYMIRYHSFYAAHREGAYDYLMSPHDREMFRWVRAFNPYDLYSKSPTPPDPQALRPYYEELVERYFPSTLSW